MLERPIDACEDPPTVLLCANGYVLAHAASDLADMGVEVPGQIELAGMDDAGPFDLLPLTIAAAHLPSEEMGRQAMTMLADRIEHPQRAREVQHMVLPVEIRTRESAAGYLRVIATR